MSIIIGQPIPALLSYKIISNNYYAGPNDYTIECTGSTNFTLTLPDAIEILHYLDEHTQFATRERELQL
jgi:hypothetical protein